MSFSYVVKRTWLKTVDPYRSAANTCVMSIEKTTLCIGRRLGETLTIGEDIEILFLEKSSNAVKVRITAPKNLKIARGEKPSVRAAEFKIIKVVSRD